VCRIAVLPKGFKDVTLLNFLEKEKGGHGNGFSYVDEEGKLQIVKGVKMENKEFVKLENAAPLALYHTRLVSAGAKDDDNTQPFFTSEITDSGKVIPFVLCHNGTWGGYDDYAKILWTTGAITWKEFCTWSDTHIMAYLIETRGIESLGLTDSSVWVRYYGDSAIVHVKSGDFQAIKKDGAWIYASEFPKTGGYEKVWDFAKGSIIRITAKGHKIMHGEEPSYVDNKAFAYTRTYSEYGQGTAAGLKHYIWVDGKRVPVTPYGNTY
jgi:glutamine phosphoribosylpyrophosphate amidotransferase